MPVCEPQHGSIHPLNHHQMPRKNAANRMMRFLMILIPISSSTSTRIKWLHQQTMVKRMTILEEMEEPVEETLQAAPVTEMVMTTATRPRSLRQPSRISISEKIN
ncbi:hypothetical protein LB505_006884 [Fusarium chuoi]|nr:hypothetical protein LB505_006884 [Fusarium chuoi]